MQNFKKAKKQKKIVKNQGKQKAQNSNLSAL